MRRLPAAAAPRVTPNVFGIPFGVCGLAQCWSVAHVTTDVPAWPAQSLWVVAAGVWVATVVAYVTDLIRGGRLGTELQDPTFAPFTAVAFIVPMLLGVALAPHARTAGVTVFAVALALTVVIGAWLTGEWIIADLRLSQWHPGYFLPTVAGGLVAAGGSAALGYRTLAVVMFGYGTVCWLVLGSVILARLFTQPALAPPLRPTIAIEVAPPVVAGNAWFALNGGRNDIVIAGLTGYAVLMILIQVRLIPVYRRVPFGPGWWAFSFSYAAASAFGIQWLAAQQPPGSTGWILALLSVITAWIGVLGAWTIRRLASRSFLSPATPAIAHKQQDGSESTAADEGPHAVGSADGAASTHAHQ
jgi:tellurite resistance protein